MDKAHREPVKSLWIGGSLSIVEQLCIKSFLSKGHPFILYVYGKVPEGIPIGVIIKNGNEILPESDIFFYSDGSNSPSGFSNRFRYKLLYEQGGWWVDLDVLCIKPLEQLSGIQFGLEDTKEGGFLANPAVMSFPKHHPVMKTCYELATEAGKNIWWGQIGPHLFTEIIKKENLMHLANSPTFFHPNPWWEADIPFKPERNDEIRERIKNSYTLHLWNAMINRFRNPKEVLPTNSYLYDIASQFPVVSIISTLYDDHIHFEETYHSVVNQTFQNFEWIIIVNCPTALDENAFIKTLSERNHKIKTFYYDNNLGLASARNMTISKTNGDYLFFLDIDAVLDITYIEKCVFFLENHPEFSFVNSYSIPYQEEENYQNPNYNTLSRFIKQNWGISQVLYRKKDFHDLKGFQLRFYKDSERIKGICNHQKGWTIPEYLFCYRSKESGLLTESLTKMQYITRTSAFNNNVSKINFDIINSLNRQATGKHILCIFPWLEIGGADKFNLDLITSLTDKGYKITILTTSKSNHPWHRHFKKVTPDIFHLPNFLQDSHWLAFTRYIVQSRRIDVVIISNSYIAYYFLSMLRSEFPNVAFIDFTHTDDPGWRGNGYPRISCQFSQYIDRQIVSSNHLAEIYQKINQSTEKQLRVCHTNVNTKKWLFDSEKRKEIRVNLGISDETIVILCPIRIVKQKRPLFLVDIVKELVSESLPISIITLGDGHLLSEMKAKIRRLGLEPFFHILPPVDPEKMLDYYSSSDIFILPSEYEGISVAIYEAMSIQLPVVASDVGGQDELVTPETGFLIPKGNGDASEIAEYLKVLIPLIKNVKLRKKIGLLARRRVEESFSMEKMSDSMETIITEAIQLHQNKPPIEFNPAIAEEVLILALEYNYIEQERDRLFWEKNRLEQEKNELWYQINLTTLSELRKMQKKWFEFKRKLKLT